MMPNFTLMRRVSWDWHWRTEANGAFLRGYWKSVVSADFSSASAYSSRSALPDFFI
jgi:hypothetical protein